MDLRKGKSGKSSLVKQWPVTELRDEGLEFKHVLMLHSAGNSIKEVIKVLTRVTRNCQSGELEHFSTPSRNPNPPLVRPITLKN